MTLVLYFICLRRSWPSANGLRNDLIFMLILADMSIRNGKCLLSVVWLVVASIASSAPPFEAQKQKQKKIVHTNEEHQKGLRSSLPNSRLGSVKCPAAC